MNYYVIVIGDSTTGVNRTYNERASRMGVAVDRALTDFLKRQGHSKNGASAPSTADFVIQVARS